VTKQARWVGISIITEIEFLAFPGLGQDDAQLFAEFLRRVTVIDLTQDDPLLLERVIALRRNHRLRLPDAVVAASALIHDACLVTADRQLLSLQTQVKALHTLAFNA
jgi:predicted nucleic acid-binding protein